MSKLWKDIVESVGGTDQDFTTGRIGRAILLLAIPMMLEMVMESLFAVVDIYFVSGLGSDAIASVGLTESLMAIIYSIGVGLSMAATGLVSRRIGEKNPGEAAFAGSQTIIISVLISIFIAVPGVILAPVILNFMGASGNTIETGKIFTSIMFGGNGIIMLLFINNAIFRSAGDAVMAMRVLWLANLVNIVLDPCLILGLGPFPQMGVTGAAVATNIGRGIGVCYQFYHLFKGKHRIKIKLKYLIPDLSHIRSVLKLASGGIGQYLIATASWIGLYRILAFYGDNVIAGYTVALRIIIFTLLPAWGISNAAATLVGQNLGAKQPDRAEKSVWITGLVNTIFLVLLGITFFSFPRFYLGFFRLQPPVMAIAVKVLRVLSMGYLFYGFGMVISQSFNGAGDTFTPTVINLVCFWIVELPLAYVLSGKFGMAENGVFWSVVIAESMLALLGVYVFSRGRWKLKQV